MRKQIVAGNWKMNCDLSEMEELLSGIKNNARQIPKDVEVVVAPPFTNLHPAFTSLRDTKISVAAQNMHEEEKGAFTGEVSAGMLKSVGVETVILGHSERRNEFKESDKLLEKKVKSALENNMKVIFCIGEELEDRKAENHFSVVEQQLKKALFGLSEKSWENLVLAYEPVWAIGTGETATPEQAQEMHRHIRKLIEEHVNNAVATKTPILYGGSVKPTNASELFAKEDVDGGLIGGASLKANDFISLTECF
jgi:triosephosphate isomerase